tara:strand:+ start:69 stop:782 length:714 start_codon:yes stop_codon:yes gene_type:complete
MRTKPHIRESVWNLLEQSGVVHGNNVHDKIPDFYGSIEAAQRVFGLDIWKSASTIKSNPDKAQQPLRQKALEDGKLLYMAVPRLKDERCFVELNPTDLKTTPAQASTISGAFKAGRLVYVEEMAQVDLVISGSVAVNLLGIRIGKGGGFADLEYGLALEAGVVESNTPVITTVHSLQVLDEELPRSPHDVPIDYIFTPEETMHCLGDLPHPVGIYWENLDDEKISEIPVLQMLRRHR